MLDVRLLHVLREVARQGSISAAAEALSYTQPAVSQQLARLERDAGVRLVERGRDGARATPAGEALVRHAERILAQLGEAEAELAEIAGGVRGLVRVGTFPTAAGTFVPRAISAFRRERPNVDVGMEFMFPGESVAAVRRGDLEVAISHEDGFGPDPDATGLAVDHLLDDPLLAALPLEHPLAGRRAVRLEDLARDKWILLQQPGSSRETNVIYKACRAAGFEPDVLQEAHDHFAVEGLVAAGMGVALMPSLTLAATRADIATRPLRSGRLRRRLVAVSAPDAGAATASMVSALRAAAAEALR